MPRTECFLTFLASLSREYVDLDGRRLYMVEEQQVRDQTNLWSINQEKTMTAPLPVNGRAIGQIWLASSEVTVISVTFGYQLLQVL